jgi:DNA-binding CsgD family transcriptional regulator
MYNEFYRRIGMEYQIAKGLPGPAGLVTTICVLRGRPDFSERDRLLLNLLRPHLNQAYRNARTFDTMHRELAALRGGMDALGQGVVLIDAEDRVAAMTTRARQWIEDYFGAGPDALPRPLAAWVANAHQATRSDDAPPAREPLTVERAGRRLVVRLVPAGEQRMLMLTEQRTERRLDELSPLGLSRRETEVLAWVTEGKTNAEIAIILGTSVRTIDKHLERILQKLGVETRTAAAAHALASLRA